jgi:transcriptional regulator with XRE-family HTH domain
MARRNMNIADVAIKSGVHRQTVSLIVNDRQENVQIDTLAKIAKAVGLETAIVFTPASEAVAA